MNTSRILSNFVPVSYTHLIGGGRANSVSILEAFERAAALSGKKMNYEYVDQNRAGDHICYISDLSKMKAHYPGWDITKTLDDVFREIYEVTSQKLKF